MSDLLKRLRIGSKLKSETLANSKYFDNGEMVTLSVPLMNLAFTGKLKTGGMPTGITVIAAKPKHFKTNFMLQCMKDFQDQYKDEDHISVLYDSEGGYTKDYFVKMGIDLDRVDHRVVTSVEEFRSDAASLVDNIKKGDKVFIGVDSLGMLPSLKEVEDAKSGSTAADMTRAKQLKSAIRIITPHITTKDLYCILLTHTYGTMELYSTEIASGGRGTQYAGHTLWIIGKSQEKDGDEIEGNNFNINVSLSRYVREKSKFSIKALYNKGIFKYSGIFDLALDHGFIKEWQDPDETPEQKKSRIAAEKALKAAAKAAKKKVVSGNTKMYDWKGEKFTQEEIEEDVSKMEELLNNADFCKAVEDAVKL